MNIDIVLVTYNSAKWIENNIKSIASSNYDLKKINLYFFDNASTDDTIKILEKKKEKYDNKFNDFQIIKGKKNYGFGLANNKASKYGKSEYIFFLNIDTKIEEDTLEKIEKEVLNEKNNKIGVWELKQLPYEHPKYYNPVTGEVSWFSGACFVIKRSLFNKVGGFDKNIFMYCEDVELSWHIRKLGYFIKYLYNVPINHYSYENENTFKINQYVYGIVNNLYLRYKYGNLLDLIRGYKIFLKLYLSLHKDEKIKEIGVNKVSKRLIIEELKTTFYGLFALISRMTYIFKSSSFKPSFLVLDYEKIKDGAFYVKKDFKETPLVSILVRTCARPDTLRETLISIRNQTYTNFEVIVIEDGVPSSKKMIETEFSDMNILYNATGEKVGRSAAANLALSLAKGKYLNFLDDDDVFYCDHIETLVSELQNSKENIVFSSAFETPIEIISKKPYIYKIRDKKIRYSFNYNCLRILVGNFLPIQSVMFDREVYQNVGNINEKMDALEDWDFWLRCSLKYRFKFIKKTTSIYRVPYITKNVDERNKFLSEPLNEVRKKYSDVKLEITSKDVIEYNEIVDWERERQLLEIINQGRLKRLFNRIRTFLKRR